MSPFKRILFLFVLSLGLPLVVSAEPGCHPYQFGRGVESGGGGTVRVDGHFATLIDLLHVDRNFRDSRPEPSSRIEVHRTILYNRYEGILSEPNIAFTYAFAILGMWREVDKSVLFSPSLEFGVIRPTTWLFLDTPICQPEKEPKETEGFAPELKLAAYFLRDRYQVNIYRSLWNKMGLRSQIGLIIHESIRHLQIGLERDFDEEVLQQATALLVMCEPKPTLSHYIQYLLNNKREAAETSFGGYAEILKDCTPAKYNLRITGATKAP